MCSMAGLLFCIETNFSKKKNHIRTKAVVCFETFLFYENTSFKEEKKHSISMVSFLSFITLTLLVFVLVLMALPLFAFYLSHLQLL